MYHCMICIRGEWVSFGLHAGGTHWSDYINTLRRVYGSENVKCTFWAKDDPIFPWPANEMAAALTVERDIRDANSVSQMIANDDLSATSSNGSPISMAAHIAQLRKTQVMSIC